MTPPIPTLADLQGIPSDALSKESPVLSRILERHVSTQVTDQGPGFNNAMFSEESPLG